jgi:hypothetical protein
MLIAFPLQQWLQEHVSLWRYTYAACLVKFNCRYKQLRLREKRMCSRNMKHSILLTT